MYSERAEGAEQTAAMGDVTNVTTAQGPSTGGPPGGVLQVQTRPPVLSAPNPDVLKVIVAVHGVGDQYTYATIQSVVNQFCGFYCQPAAVPLGNFHNGEAGFSIQPPYPRDPFGRLAFAEVYWAKVPRTVVDDKHTIEESKKWAGTIVERLRLRWRHAESKGHCTDADFDFIKLVLTEMIQTLAVLERLSYLADKAGLFTFDLRKLLEDYLGDVQIVTEFGTERRMILDEFARVMTGVHTAYPNAEIFVVAHSEGTVVSFLGLLEAGRNRTPSGWINCVRGFMTIGSPIDKHLILWPELFSTKAPALGWTPAKKIEWRNYYDHGDPIGSALDDARAWLTAYEWDRVFNFTEKDDFGFVRYPFPGKAHVDYWTDPAVFGHFIQTVVNEPTPDVDGKPADFTNPPGDRPWEKWLSYVLPYVGVAALLFVAVYVLYKAVVGAISPNDDDANSTRVIFRGVAASALLLLGITVVTRIPRLTSIPWWRGIAIVIGVLLAGVSLWILSGQPLAMRVDGWLNVTVAAVMAVAVTIVTHKWPNSGLKPLIFLGTASVAGIVGYHLYWAKKASDIGPLWPVFLATAAFLYVWWLAALIFDLVFVWHLQIRQSKALERMNEMIGGSSWKSPRAQRAQV